MLRVRLFGEIASRLCAPPVVRARAGSRNSLAAAHDHGHADILLGDGQLLVDTACSMSSAGLGRISPTIRVEGPHVYTLERNGQGQSRAAALLLRSTQTCTRKAMQLEARVRIASPSGEHGRVPTIPAGDVESSAWLHRGDQ